MKEQRVGSLIGNVLMGCFGALALGLIAYGFSAATPVGVILALAYGGFSSVLLLLFAPFVALGGLVVYGAGRAHYAIVFGAILAVLFEIVIPEVRVRVNRSEWERSHAVTLANRDLLSTNTNQKYLIIKMKYYDRCDEFCQQFILKTDLKIIIVTDNISATHPQSNEFERDSRASCNSSSVRYDFRTDVPPCIIRTYSGPNRWTDGVLIEEEKSPSDNPCWPDDEFLIYEVAHGGRRLLGTWRQGEINLKGPPPFGQLYSAHVDCGPVSKDGYDRSAYIDDLKRVAEKTFGVKFPS